MKASRPLAMGCLCVGVREYDNADPSVVWFPLVCRGRCETRRHVLYRTVDTGAELHLDAVLRARSRGRPITRPPSMAAAFKGNLLLGTTLAFGIAAFLVVTLRVVFRATRRKIGVSDYCILAAMVGSRHFLARG